MSIPPTDIGVSTIINEMDIGGSYGTGVGEYPLSYIDTYLARDGWSNVNSYSQRASDYSFAGLIGLCGRKSYELNCAGCTNANTNNWTTTINLSLFTDYPASMGPNFDAAQLTSSVVSNGSSWDEIYFDGNIDSVTVNWVFTGRPPGNNVNISDNNGVWAGSPFPGSASSASIGGGLAIDNCIDYIIAVTT